jgi:hypothetical protein
VPRDAGVRRIGHFGFFRKEFEGPLWRAHLLLELRAQTTQASPPPGWPQHTTTGSLKSNSCGA